MEAARKTGQSWSRISEGKLAGAFSIRWIGNGQRFHPYFLWAFLLLFTGFSAAQSASAVPQQDSQTGPQPVQTIDTLPDGQTITAEIPARPGKRIFSISACAGCFVQIQIEQLDLSMPIATLSGPGIANPIARFCDFGIHSVARIPFVAPQSANYRLEIHVNLPSVARVRITLAKFRPAADADQDPIAAYDALARAEALRRGNVPSTAGQAIADYDQAIELAQKDGKILLQQQALIGKTRIFIYLEGDYLAGLKTAEAAKALLGKEEKGGSPEATVIDAAAWKVVASANYFLARYPSVIDATNRSLALYGQLGDLYWQGILDGNVANAYLETGDMQHALSSAEDALSIARKLSDQDGISFTLATVAMIHFLRGEYQAAFDANEGALDEIALKPFPDEEGQVWMGLGELYDELNDPERERDALNRALLLLHQTHDAVYESTVLSDLALLDLRQGRPRQGAQSLQQAMEIARSHHLNNEQSLALLGQAIVSVDEGHSAAADQAVRDGLALARKTGEVADAALLLQEQGDLNARLGKTQPALAAYREAEFTWSTIPNLEHAALARASMARLELRSGEIPQARSDILQALDGFEASRRNVGGRSLRESFFASVHDFYDLAIDLDMREGSAAQTDEALEIAERARARSLMDSVRASSAFSTAAVPRSLIDQSADIERQVAATQQAISRLGIAGEHGAALQKQTDLLHDLVLQSEDVEAKERKAASPSLADAVVHPVTPARLKTDLVDSETALLEYWVGRGSVYRWVITPTAIRGARLCSTSTLAAAVEAYRKSLLAREEFPSNEELAARDARLSSADHELDRQAALLARLLIPASLPPEVHRLVIVPDGVLASVPFAALRPDAAEFLIERYELVEEPSASVAMELVARAGPTHHKDRIAVFADPVYNRFDPRLAQPGNAATLLAAKGAPSDAHVLRSDVGFDLSALPRLSGSLTEAHSIASIAGTDRVETLLGFQATPEQVMHLDWRNFSIAHFATHAIVDPVHPELSGIVLSTLDRNGKPQDGILWLHDIYRTPMPVSLVILSGCRTASGRSIPGEGISGLAKAFLSSGASGVVGTLWSVDDAAAGEMVPWFYRALIDRHLGIAGALREAQIKMLSRHQPPYDWAGYIVEGNWRTTASPEAP